jgi:hypothetical protein
MQLSQGSIDTDTEDSGSECVICMCDGRDTLILPCRHLCLCNSCADSLRYQANNCPICRAPFRALLQIRALQKNSGQPLPIPPTAAAPSDVSGHLKFYVSLIAIKSQSMSNNFCKTASRQFFNLCAHQKCIFRALLVLFLLATKLCL